MISSVGIKQKLFRIAEIIHLRIFGHEMGEGIPTFLGNLNYTFIAAVVVGALIYSLNVIAGRRLSVENYGQYQLALSLSFFFTIPILMGLTTASTHAVAKEGSDPKRIISSVFPLVVFFGVVSIPLMLFFSKNISRLIGVNSNVVTVAIIYTIFFSFYSVSRSFLQGFLYFRRIALFEIAYAVTTFISFVVIIFLGSIGFWSPLIALSLGFFVFSTLCIPILRDYLSLSSFSNKTGKLLLQNGFIMVAASVSGFLLANVDKFIINRLIDIESVALYSAYIYSAGLFLNFFLQTFITVFFPSMSKVENIHKVEINKKINKLYLTSFPILLISSFVFITLSVALFGEKYKLDYYYVGLFSLYIVIQFLVSTKQWFLISFGDKGMLFSTYSTILASVANVIIVYLLTERYGLIGTISGLIISLVLFALINSYFLDLILKNYKK